VNLGENRVGLDLVWGSLSLGDRVKVGCRCLGFGDIRIVWGFSFTGNGGGLGFVVGGDCSSSWSFFGLLLVLFFCNG